MGTVHLRVDGIPLAKLNELFDHPHTPWFDHVVHEGTIYAQLHNNELPNKLVWDFFKFRHDLAPHRFDHWHPHLGKLIERSEQPHGCEDTHVVVPPIPCDSTSTPEPSSLLLGFIAIVIYFIGRIYK